MFAKQRFKIQNVIFSTFSQKNVEKSYNMPIVPRRAGGGRFKGQKKYTKEELAWRTRAGPTTSAMPESKWVVVK